MLSYGGKVALINSVLTSLVLYMLSFHTIPKGILKQIDKIRADFLWHSGDRKRYHLIKWSAVCRPKKEGGLGVKNLQIMNDALLCKWSWKMRDPLYYGWWKEIVKIKYENSFNIQHWSPFWRSVKRLEPIVNIHCRYKVGDGTRVRFWEDKWCGECTLSVQYSSLYNICLDKKCTVSQIIERGVAHLRFSRQLSERHCVALNELYFIVSSLRLTHDSDSIVWTNNSTGAFSVRDLYTWLDHRGVVDNSCAHIWKIKVPSKIQIFFWLLCKDRLLTRDNLAMRGWEGDVSCVYCPSMETINHAFFTCPQIQPVWRWFGYQFDGIEAPANVIDLVDSLSHIDCSLHQALKIWWCAILWTVWLSRNDCCFRDIQPITLRSIGIKIVALLTYWADMWDPVLRSQVMGLMVDLERLPMQLTFGASSENDG